METEHLERLKRKIEEIETSVNEKTAAKLELDKCRRLSDRLYAFSADCKECLAYFYVLDSQVANVSQLKQNLTKEDFKRHHNKVEEVSSHLKEKHELVSDGYYMSIYMSLGISLGLLFGLVIFDNIALGLPIGMIIGIAIGTGKDKEAKKQGKVI